MLAFFYSLFLALIRGQWQTYSYAEVGSILNTLLNRTSSLIVNALGGQFVSQETFLLVDGTNTSPMFLATILAVVAMVMVCMLTFKLTKMVFSIFFGGR